MKEVDITLNGRVIRLACGDGDQTRAERLADHVRRKVDQLIREHGQVGDDRLLLMAAMMISDELFETRDALAASDAELTRVQALVPDQTSQDDETRASETVAS